MTCIGTLPISHICLLSLALSPKHPIYLGLEIKKLNGILCVWQKNAIDIVLLSSPYIQFNPFQLWVVINKADPITCQLL